MSRGPRVRLLARSLAAGAVVVATVSACALPEPAAVGEPAPDSAAVIEAARSASSLRGRSSAAVKAALGPATVIAFDSGYAVWVYRFHEPATRKAAQRARASPEPPEAAELVLLVTPSGVVSRVRVRSPSP
jgi:hypothetical protein